MTYYISAQTQNGFILSETRTTDERIYDLLLKHYITVLGVTVKTWTGE